jgi:hypothetical protein
MNSKFEFEFEDESLGNSISFEYSESTDEILSVSIDDSGVATIYGNREAFMVLAKTFAKLALGNYKEGFHFHLREDFDGDKKDIIEIILVK